MLETPLIKTNNNLAIKYSHGNAHLAAFLYHFVSGILVYRYIFLSVGDALL